MSEQLQALNAVLPVKWPFPSVNKAGWAPGLVQAGMRKRQSLAPHRGSNPTVQPVATPSMLSPLPAIQRVLVCLWHTVGEKIMKIYVIKIYTTITPKLCSSIL